MLQGFFQHGGVSISTFIGWIDQVCFVPGEWNLYPCQIDNNRASSSDGPALDRDSVDELQPGCYVMRTPPPGEHARVFLLSYSLLIICVTESAQVVVYLTTDVPRTRAYSVDYSSTSTADVRFRFLLLLGLRRSLTICLRRRNS